jgi:hypothetical protein
MNIQGKQPKDSIEEYTWMCNMLFGTYMDAIWGFELVRGEADKCIANSTGDRPPFMSFIPKDHDPDAPIQLTHEQMLARNVNFELADKIAERNSMDGQNCILIAQMTIVTIYQYWEDKYRKKIADELHLTSRNDLKIDGMGDIRQFRISILHNKGLATPEVELTKRFRWFRTGDFIRLDFDRMLEIKNYIMTDFRNECLGASQLSK